jgi:hypothetical protein
MAITCGDTSPPVSAFESCARYTTIVCKAGADAKGSISTTTGRVRSHSRGGDHDFRLGYGGGAKSAARRLILQHANVIEGVSAQPMADVMIDMRNGRIVSVGPTRAEATSPADEVIDLGADGCCQV